MATMNVSLPDAMREWVETRVSTGEYANASDYVRDLIRQDLRQVEELRQALIEGEKSGISPYTIDEIAERVKAQFKHG